MRVEFPKAVRAQMRKALSRAGRREIGGVLMAEQIEAGRFRIVDFSLDAEIGGAAHFVRSVEHHHAALSEFYERTESDFSRFNYLGEWHSHPNHLPIPSTTDVMSMASLVEGERDIPFALLLIVRATWWRRMAMSATLFQQGRPPEPAEILTGEGAAREKAL